MLAFGSIGPRSAELILEALDDDALETFRATIEGELRRRAGLVVDESAIRRKFREQLALVGVVEKGEPPGQRRMDRLQKALNAMKEMGVDLPLIDVYSDEAGLPFSLLEFMNTVDWDVFNDGWNIPEFICLRALLRSAHVMEAQAWIGQEQAFPFP